jgi:hypothetical protein
VQYSCKYSSSCRLEYLWAGVHWGPDWNLVVTVHRTLRTVAFEVASKMVMQKFGPMHLLIITRGIKEENVHRSMRSAIADTTCVKTWLSFYIDSIIAFLQSSFWSCTLVFNWLPVFTSHCRPQPWRYLVASTTSWQWVWIDRTSISGSRRIKTRVLEQR